MSLCIRPSISRIESVTLKMGERVLANGRSGTRELPFCLAQRTILHPVRRLPTRPSPPLLLPRRFLFRTEIFLERRHSGTPSAKSRSRQVLLEARRRPPRIIPRSPFGAIFPRRHVSAACYARACVFYFYSSSRPDFTFFPANEVDVREPDEG